MAIRAAGLVILLGLSGCIDGALTSNAADSGVPTEAVPPPPLTTPLDSAEFLTARETAATPMTPTVTTQTATAATGSGYRKVVSAQVDSVTSSQVTISWTLDQPVPPGESGPSLALTHGPAYCACPDGPPPSGAHYVRSIATLGADEDFRFAIQEYRQVDGQWIRFTLYEGSFHTATEEMRVENLTATANTTTSIDVDFNQYGPGRFSWYVQWYLQGTSLSDGWMGGHRSHDPTTGRSVSLFLSRPELIPDNAYEIVVTVTNDRNQTASANSTFVVPPGDPAAYDNFNVTFPTNSSAHLTWDHWGTRDAEGKVCEGKPWRSWLCTGQRLSEGGPVVLTNLRPGTIYDYQISRPGSEPAYSNFQQFETPP